MKQPKTKQSFRDCWGDLATEKVLRNIELTQQKIIPESWDITEDDIFVGNKFGLRWEFIEYGGYALVAKDWTSKLAKWIGSRKCLEIGAGAGMLAKALLDCGVDLIAVDDFSWKKFPLWKKNLGKRLWAEIHWSKSHVAIRKYGKETDILIMSWPPQETILDLVTGKSRYTGAMAVNAVKQFKKYNPDGLIVYIGEDRGGCTANGAFFNAVEFIKNDRNFNAAAKLFKSWPLIYDGLFLAKAK